MLKAALPLRVGSRIPLTQSNPVEGSLRATFDTIYFSYRTMNICYEKDFLPTNSKSNGPLFKAGQWGFRHFLDSYDSCLILNGMVG